MIKCVAIDDEPIALSIIEEYCRRYGDVELHTFTSPVAGIECVKAMRPDVVFMDIEMKSHNGVALASELPQGTCLIFTTAFSNYALDGFNADAVDFLHKPIFYPRFERAMEKARRYIDVDQSARQPESLTLKVEHKTVIVNLSEIQYVEAMDNYVKIYRRNKPMVLPQMTMKEMESRLPADAFVRVHRSFIVAIAEVERFSNRRISLRTVDRILPVGRKYIATFNSILSQLSQSES